MQQVGCALGVTATAFNAQLRHLKETWITWDESSGITETIPLFAVHPHEHHELSKRSGNFIPSVE